MLRATGGNEQLLMGDPGGRPLMSGPKSLAQHLPGPLEESWSNSCHTCGAQFYYMFPSSPPLLRYTESSQQVCFHGNHTVTQGFGTFSEPDYEYQMRPPRTNAE